MNKKRSHNDTNSMVWISISVAATLISAAIYLYVDYSYGGRADLLYKLYEVVHYVLVAGIIGLVLSSIAVYKTNGKRRGVSIVGMIINLLIVGAAFYTYLFSL